MPCSPKTSTLHWAIPGFLCAQFTVHSLPLFSLKLGKAQNRWPPREARRAFRPSRGPPQPHLGV
jgi:hypothetical protein